MIQFTAGVVFAIVYGFVFVYSPPLFVFFCTILFMLDLVWDGQSTTSVQKVYSRYHERIRIECFRCDEIRFYGSRQQVK